MEAIGRRDGIKAAELRESSVSDSWIPSYTSSCFSSQLESLHLRESTLRSPTLSVSSPLWCPLSVLPPHPASLPPSPPGSLGVALFWLLLSSISAFCQGAPSLGIGASSNAQPLFPKLPPHLSLPCLLPPMLTTLWDPSSCRDLFHCSPFMCSIHSLLQAFFPLTAHFS